MLTLLKKVKEDINIEELFKDKFENFEGNVSPDAWANISSAIGSSAATTAVTGGLSTFAKVAIVSGGIVVASIAGVLIYNSVNGEEETNQPVKEESPIVENNEITENTEPSTTFIVEDKNDSAIINDTEEIAEAMEENELEEITVSEETVEEILSWPESKISMGMMFNTILNKDKSSGNDEVKPSETDIVVAGTEKKDDSETNNEEITVDEVEIVEIEEIDIDNNSGSNETQELSDAECVSVPNIFTPNGDFTNDVWTIETADLEVFRLEVISATTGESVFSTSDKEFEWDGTNFLNERVKAGVYNYIIVAERESNGKKLVKQGSVTVQY